eukprot:810244-Karenia_brevis.AAC.1
MSKKATVCDTCQQDWTSGDALCNLKSSDLRQLSASKMDPKSGRAPLLDRSFGGLTNPKLQKNFKAIRASLGRFGKLWKIDWNLWELWDGPGSFWGKLWEPGTPKQSLNQPQTIPQPSLNHL